MINRRTLLGFLATLPFTGLLGCCTHKELEIPVIPEQEEPVKEELDEVFEPGDTVYLTDELTQRDRYNLLKGVPGRVIEVDSNTVNVEFVMNLGPFTTDRTRIDVYHKYTSRLLRKIPV